MITIRLTIRGKVQGVFFRQSARDKASELGIGGKVRNCRDGSVEIIATAPEESLRIFAEWCRLGPPRSIVHAVEEEIMPLEHFTSFKIVH